MKTTFYFLCALGALSVVTAAPADAASTPKTVLSEHTAASRTSTPEAVSVRLGRPKKKRTSSAPTKLNRQLRQRQNELKAKAHKASQAMWKRCHRGF